MDNAYHGHTNSLIDLSPYKFVRNAMIFGNFIEIKGKAVSGQAIRDVYFLKGFEASVRAAHTACREIKSDFDMYQASWSGGN